MALRIVSPASLYPPHQNPRRCRGTSPLLRLSGAPRFVGSSNASHGHAPAAALLEEESPLLLREQLAGVVSGEEEEILLVQELEELPEQWRRSKVAWLCKQLPGQKPGNLTRLLNAQRKWISQQDVTYVVVHCLRTRENDAAFKVYKWILSQPRFRFDFALASKLADCLGKDRKFLKCREVFDDIIKQGRVPSESTFQNLLAAYLSAASSVQGCLDEACSVYNKMIQLGGYSPRLSLHNALFRALLSSPGPSSKRHLEQAEFIFSNLAECGMEIQKDVYAGMIRLHSHQDLVDMGRIKALRETMREMGMAEDSDVLVSVLRACSKVGDVEEADRAWRKLLDGEPGSSTAIPPQAFVYRMELHSRAGEPLRSLEILRSMPAHGVAATAAAYDKVLEVMAGAREIEAADEILGELVASGLKPSPSSFASVMNMYLGLGMHDKIELLFAQCRSRIQPSRGVYNVYLNSLANAGDLEKAEEIFSEMQANPEAGINSASCNAMLGAFLGAADHAKAEKIYKLMTQKRYEIDPALAAQLDRILRSNRKMVDKPATRPKLDVEQREILIGLLLGGLRLESDESARSHSVHFEFNEDNRVHSLLRTHIHQRFLQWLASSSRANDEDDGSGVLPHQFSTVPHWSFNFFAEKFRAKGRPTIPILIHRWLSERALAYWYMYGGLRSSSGDILLRLKSGELDEDVQKIVKLLQAKSMGCRVKKKGKTFWIGLQGSDAALFWKLAEPYILEGAKEHLEPGGDGSSPAKMDAQVALNSEHS